MPFPEMETELRIVGKRLEREFRDMQDFEFTIQEGNLARELLGLL